MGHVFLGEKEVNGSPRAPGAPTFASLNHTGRARITLKKPLNLYILSRRGL